MTKNEARRQADSRRALALENKRVAKFMKEVGIPMNIERVRAIEKDVIEKRVSREIFEQAAHIADLVERLQENDHGAANTGGAAAAAKAIRDCARIFFGERKPSGKASG